MNRLAQIEKQVASMRKAEQALAPSRAKAAARQAAVVYEQRAVNLKPHAFSALCNMPVPESKRRTPKPLSKSARRRIKLHKQFEAIGSIEHSIVRRKHH